MSDQDHLSGSWLGYGAALWALIFAAFHIVWATGWCMILLAGMVKLPLTAVGGNRAALFSMPVVCRSQSQAQ
jgi:hypothetical protein